MTRALFHGRRYRFAVTVGRSRFRNIYIGGEGGSGNGLITSNGGGDPGGGNPASSEKNRLHGKALESDWPGCVESFD